MLENYFYHERIRKSVALFGSLFKEIYILRKNSSGAVISTVRVPLSYAPKQKYLDRLRETPDLTDDTKVAIKLPRMSFEIINFSYSPDRQMIKTNIVQQPGTATTNKTKLFSSVPYIINFQLNVLSKTQDDALQIVEQIVPYFSPQYNLSIKPFADFDIVEDVPIVLQGITFLDNFEGGLQDRRSIMYTLDFEMQAHFYGPTATTPEIIRKITNNLHLMNAGPADSDVQFSTLTVEPNPLGASPDSDFGFTTTIVETVDSA
jgi:hypothetical protein